jgi:hypothetical protein
MEAKHATDTYTPGHCNIGPAEIRKRLRIGYTGLAFMVLYMIGVEIFHLPQIWKLGLFAPAAYSFSGFLQGWQRFCFWFGLSGLFSMTGRKAKISDHASLQKDRKKAWKLIFGIFVLSMLVTLAYYYM